MGKIRLGALGSEVRWRASSLRTALTALAALFALSACSVDEAFLATPDLLVVAAASDAIETTALGIDGEPLDGRTVSGVVTVRLATNKTITQVAFYVDDPHGERPPFDVTTRTPFQTTLDTRLLADGPHLLTAVASGRNGRRGSTFTNLHEASFVVANDPTSAPAPAPTPEPEPEPEPAPEPEPEPPVVSPPPSEGPSAADILWHADHSVGTLGEWSADGCGGAFNNGGATATATTAVARSGTHSAALTISNVTGDQGARLFRWCESRSVNELYYSTWMYFPEAFVTTGGWWNVVQFKSKVSSSVNDAFFILNVSGPTSGAMRFYLYDWQERRSFTQSVATLPVGRWVHVEVRYRSSANADGAITVWQDGVVLFDVSGVRTRYADGDTQWSVNNYTSGIHPDPATIYVDDATISRTRVGPATDVGALLRAGTATATR